MRLNILLLSYSADKSKKTNNAKVKSKQGVEGMKCKKIFLNTKTKAWH